MLSATVLLSRLIVIMLNVIMLSVMAHLPNHEGMKAKQIFMPIYKYPQPSVWPDQTSDKGQPKRGLGQGFNFRLGWFAT